MIKNVKFNNEDYKRILLNNNVVWQKEEGGIPSRYVMATDDDFSGTTNGDFRYIGSGEYVIIPEYIKGVKVTSYSGMFSAGSHQNLKGVANTTSEIITMAVMFYDITCSEIELLYLNTPNVTNMGGMFRNTINLTELDLSSFDTSSLIHHAGMFRNTGATIGYARTQADADRFNSTILKPVNLTFVVK